MRIGIVRTDLGQGVYLADIDSRVQRCFSHEPPGQSMTIKRPTDAQFLDLLNVYGVLSLRGSDNNANVDTDPNDTLMIWNPTANAFVSIAVTSGNVTAKTVILADLNAGFLANSLPYVASLVGNRIQIDTVGPNAGPASILDIDTFANGSTLNTPLGFVDGSSAHGLTVAALKAAVYPTAVTINVSSACITGLSTFASLTTVQKAALTLAVADLVAPQLVETGLVKLSTAHGVISKLRSATFQPTGLIAGIGAATVENDGVSVYMLAP
jgi:hypothetical protein